MRVPEAHGGGQPNLSKCAHDPKLGVAHPMHRQRFGQRSVDGLARVQAAVGVLEHHLHPLEKGPATLWGKARAVDGHHTGPVVIEPGQGAQDRGFPRTALADDAKA